MFRFLEEYFGKWYHPVIHRIRLYFNNIKNKRDLYLKLKNEQVISNEVIGKNHIFIDMSDIFRNDVGTGIQRVSKNVALNLKKLSNKYDIEYIYDDKSWYKKCSNNEDVNFKKGDIFFLLDNSLQNLIKFKNLILYLSKHGVRTVLFLHDIIPIRLPFVCAKNVIKNFNRASKTFFNFDQIICNSASTMKDVQGWLQENKKKKMNKNLKVSYSLLGADFSNFSNHQVPDYKNYSPDKPVTFLMVSTVEPRKMYSQAVKAFNVLWEKSFNVNLVIVGRRGWNSTNTFKLIEKNPHLGKELIWYDSGINDEKLAELYGQCDAVLFASISEGFGLAVAEGAYFKKPLILRDLPVFHEIAGDNAFYFTGEKAVDLSSRIEQWLQLYEKGAQPKSDSIQLLTWEDCSKKILTIIESL